MASPAKYSAKIVLPFLFFIVFWITPLLYLGTTNRYAPWTPKAFHNLHQTFRLFIGKFEWWPMTYLQGRVGQGAWFVLPETDYFTMKPFGYRTRLTRYQEIFQKRGALAHDELLAWVKNRHANLHPDEPRLTEVRLVVGRHKVRKHHEPGIWQKPAIETLPNNDLFVLATRTFDADSHEEKTAA